MAPKISIIIVNYNGRKWLRNCLNSVLNQTYKNFEIIVVDNASTDDSVDFLRTNFKKVTLITARKNFGFAGGNNIGMQHANGEYFVLLNNDITVDKDFLEKFVDVFEKFPRAAIAQSKIVMMNNSKIIDSCGSFWTDSTFLYHIGNDKQASLDKYNKPFQVFTVKGAAMIVKRKIIDEIGMFDEDFWCYYEETDLCHRAWLAGYECIYWPNAVIYHAQGGTSLTFGKEKIQFHNFKNKPLSFIKNFELLQLLYILPVHIFFSFVISVLWIVQRKPMLAMSIYKSLLWNILNIKNTLRKRKQIQSIRQVGDSKYLAVCKKNPALSYYRSMFTRRFETYED